MGTSTRGFFSRSALLLTNSRTPSRRRRGAIRRLDGRRFSGAQAWPAPAHHARIRLRDGRTAGGASARWWRADVAHPWTGRCRITLAPHGAAACSRRARFCLARRRAACWRSLGGKSSGVHIAPPAGDPGVEWGVLCARRRVAGDVPGLWRGRRHARITQRRHVGEPEPE